MNELLVRIRFLMAVLPRAERNVAQSLLDRPELIRDLTLAQLSKAIRSNDATIIRFCKRLGYRGYTETKQAFAKAIADGSTPAVEQIEPDDSAMDILQKIYHSNMQTLSDTLLLTTNEYERAVDALLGAEKINFFGAGDAAMINQLFAMKFKKIGMYSSAEFDPVMQLIEAGNMTRGDVAIAVSYEGRSSNVLHAMQVAREQGATVIAITKMRRSPMLRYSDINLFIATSDVTIARDLVARRVAEQMIIDALYVSFLMRRGEITDQAVMSKMINRNKVRQ